MADVSHSFPKSEKLRSKKIIDEIFAKKSSKEIQGLGISPLYFHWIPAKLIEEVQVQVLFSISKKSFKKAVDRNRLRRQMREVYRLNKQRLFAVLPANMQIALVLSYTAKEKLPYEQINNAFIKIIQKLAKQI